MEQHAPTAIDREDGGRSLTAEGQSLVLANLGLAGAIARQFTRGDPLQFPDVMADAAVALCRAAAAHRPERGSFSTFGTDVARNYLINKSRAGRRARRRGDATTGRFDPHDMDVTIAARTNAAEAEAEVAEVAVAIRAAIRRLGPRTRRVVEARMDGRTLAQVAAEMGVSRGRARVIERAAHGRLRELLAGVAP